MKKAIIVGNGPSVRWDVVRDFIGYKIALDVNFQKFCNVVQRPPDYIVAVPVAEVQ